MKNAAIMIAALTLIASPAEAKTKFAAYDGPDAEQTGTGGTHVDMKGIDLWTNGSPARRYRVIGIIEDQRKDRLLDGDPTDSPAVAKLARANGADALILLGQDSQAAGFAASTNLYGAGASVFGNTHGRVVNRRFTRFAAIKMIP